MRFNQTSSPDNVIGALAAGFREAGVWIVTNYPGFHSNELMETYHGDKAITSVDEKTAYGVAWGAAIGGRRAAATMKNVGLNDAADAFLNSLHLDVNAGLVLVVFDDTDVEHSQIRMDSRHFQSFAGGIWLEPSTLGEAGKMAVEAFDLSERFQSPVVLRITNALYARGGRGSCPASRPVPRLPFLRDPAKRVVHPINHLTQQAVLAAKQTLWREWAEQRFTTQSPVTPVGREILHLIFGSARPPAPDEGSFSIRIPTLPLPIEKLRELVREFKSVIVHEHGDPVVAGMLAAAVPQLPVLSNSSGCMHPNRKYHERSDHEPLFKILRSQPDRIVVGDLGGFTIDPHRTVDACLCYGTSVACAIGLALACPEHVVICVTGDGAYLHSGKSAVPEATARGCNLMIVVFENGGCLGTGGQAVPGSTWGATPDAPEFHANMSDPVDELAMLVESLSKRPGVKILHLTT